MPGVFISAMRRFSLLLIASAFLPFVLHGCVSDKECWEPDFSDRPVHDKKEYKAEKKN